MTPTLTRPSAPAAAADLDSRFHEIVDELTRRGFLAGMLGGAALLGLAACDSDDTGARPPSAAASPSTRQVATAYGAVTVPADPQRVVCLDWFSPEILMELGITPTGYSDQSGNNVTLAANRTTLERRATNLGAITDLAPERIAALRPDVILGLDWPVFKQATLSKIAPTVLLPWNSTSGDWKTFSEQFADAVGRRAQLDRLKEQYEQKAATVRSTYAAELAQLRWAIVEGGTDGNFLLYVPDYAGAVTLADGGVRFLPGLAGTTGTYQNVSLEKLDTLADADVIVYPTDPAGKPSSATAALLEQTAFKRLAAARADRVVALQHLFSISYGTGAALLDELATTIGKVTA